MLFSSQGLHEAWITPYIVACTEAHKPPFPAWAVIFGHISNVLMAVNSSVNCIIYGLISPQFRKAMVKKARSWGFCKKSNLSRSLRRAPSMGVPLRDMPDVTLKDCPNIVVKATSNVSANTLVCN